MSAGDAVRDDLDDEVPTAHGGVSNVLVLGASMDPAVRRTYLESFMPSSPERLDVLAVNYRQTVDDWLDEWRQYAGGVPGSCTIVSVNDQVRSAAPSQSAGPDPSPGGPVIDYLENPADLTGLGITVSEYLAEGVDETTVVTFDSLTVLLQYVDLQRAFRFLHVLVNRIRKAGAVGHFHLDPDAHDEQTVATLASLFDAVAEYDDGWQFRAR